MGRKSRPGPSPEKLSAWVATLQQQAKVGDKELWSEYRKNLAKLFPVSADFFHHVPDHLARQVAKCLAQFGLARGPIQRLAGSPWNLTVDALLEDFGPSVFASKNFWIKMEEMRRRLTTLATESGTWKDVAAWPEVRDVLRQTENQRLQDGRPSVPSDRSWQPSDVTVALQVLDRRARGLEDVRCNTTKPTKPLKLTKTPSRQGLRSQSENVEDTQVVQDTQDGTSLPRSQSEMVQIGQRSTDQGRVPSSLHHRKIIANADAIDIQIQHNPERRSSRNRKRKRPESDIEAAPPDPKRPNKGPRHDSAVAKGNSQAATQYVSRSPEAGRAYATPMSEQVSSFLPISLDASTLIADDQRPRSPISNVQGDDDNQNDDDHDAESGAHENWPAESQLEADDEHTAENMIAGDANNDGGDFGESCHASSFNNLHDGCSSTSADLEPAFDTNPLEEIDFGYGPRPNASMASTLGALMPRNAIFMAATIPDHGHWAVWRIPGVHSAMPYDVADMVIIPIYHPDTRHWNLVSFQPRLGQAYVYNSINVLKSDELVRRIARDLASYMNLPPPTIIMVHDLQQRSRKDSAIYVLVAALSALTATPMPSLVNVAEWQTILSFLVNPSSRLQLPPVRGNLPVKQLSASAQHAAFMNTVISAMHTLLCCDLTSYDQQEKNVGAEAEAVRAYATKVRCIEQSQLASPALLNSRESLLDQSIDHVALCEKELVSIQQSRTCVGTSRDTTLAACSAIQAWQSQLENALRTAEAAAERERERIRGEIVALEAQQAALDVEKAKMAAKQEEMRRLLANV